MWWQHVGILHLPGAYDWVLSCLVFFGPRNPVPTKLSQIALHRLEPGAASSSYIFASMDVWFFNPFQFSGCHIRDLYPLLSLAAWVLTYFWLAFLHSWNPLQLLLCWPFQRYALQPLVLLNSAAQDFVPILPGWYGNSVVLDLHFCILTAPAKPCLSTGAIL